MSTDTDTFNRTTVHLDGTSYKNAFGEVYPNPVLQFATVSFYLAKASSVKITITDIQGKLLRILADDNFLEGTYSIKFDRETLPAGMYFLQAKTNYGVMMKKILMIC